MADLDVEKRIRRLRKKLIQISNLEILPRELNDEESIKVGKKTELRAELQRLLGETEMKRKQNSDQAPDLKTSPTKVKKPSGSGSGRSSSRTSRSSATQQALSQQSADPDQHANDHTQAAVSVEAVQEPHLEADQPQRVEAQQPGIDGHDQEAGADVPTTSVPSSRSTVVTSSSDLVSQAGTSTDAISPAGSSAASKSTAAEKNKPPTSTASAPRPEVKSAEIVKLWRKRSWTVEELEGHEDRVLDCDIDVENSVIVTASCDTTIKVWDLHTGVLTHSLRGHTGPVTGARILCWRGHPEPDTTARDAEEPPLLELDIAAQLRQAKIVVVSGSIDCSLKIWSLEDCRAVSSIYTYNGISKLKIIQKLKFSVSGTEGGKLEVYNLLSGRLVSSQTLHQEAVTALSVHESDDKIMMASGSSDGIIKVFQVLEDRLRCLFVSENVCSVSVDTSLHTRPVSALYITEAGTVYYGDTGHNLKLLDWRHNRAHKFANHTSDQGFTDSITGTGEVMLATGYDVDTGCGQINIYRPRTDQIPQYLATLSDNQTDRISVMCVAESCRGDVFIVSGGHDLKVWKSQRSRSGTTSRDASTSIQGCILSLGDSSLVDSGTEMDSDLEEEDRLPHTTRPDLGQSLPVKPASGFCNCVIS